MLLAIHYLHLAAKSWSCPCFTLGFKSGVTFV